MRPILAVRTSDLNVSNGFVEDVEQIGKLFDAKKVRIVDRDTVETDESYKQIIPYVVIFNQDGNVFRYVRGKAGGEDRLHDLMSIGVGGHIDYHDNEFRPTIADVSHAATREVLEEIGSDVNQLFQIGLVFHDETEVGRVHIGVVYAAVVADVAEFEDTITDPEFVTIDDLKQDAWKMEEWSKMIVEHGILDDLFEELS